MSLHDQYENIAREYSNFKEKITTENGECNSNSTEDDDQSDCSSWAHQIYFKYFPESLNDKAILDLGCGPGLDIMKFRKMGAKIVAGLDASNEMCKIAAKNAPNAIIKHGLFDEKTYPFDAETFDIVASKFALQTTENIDDVIEETARVLKPGGYIIWLIVHPIRQYMEKLATGSKDYFQRDICTSNLYNNTMTVYEPSHTLQEYFSTKFFHHFTLKFFEENTDDSAEQINGCRYAHFFIIKAVKN